MSTQKTKQSTDIPNLKRITPPTLSGIRENRIDHMKIADLYFSGASFEVIRRKLGDAPLEIFSPHVFRFQDRMLYNYFIPPHNNKFDSQYLSHLKTFVETPVGEGIKDNPIIQTEETVYQYFKDPDPAISPILSLVAFHYFWKNRENLFPLEDPITRRTLFQDFILTCNPQAFFLFDSAEWNRRQGGKVLVQHRVGLGGNQINELLAKIISSDNHYNLSDSREYKNSKVYISERQDHVNFPGITFWELIRSIAREKQSKKIFRENKYRYMETKYGVNGLLFKLLSGAPLNILGAKKEDLLMFFPGKPPVRPLDIITWGFWHDAKTSREDADYKKFSPTVLAEILVPVLRSFTEKDGMDLIEEPITPPPIKESHDDIPENLLQAFMFYTIELLKGCFIEPWYKEARIIDSLFERVLIQSGGKAASEIRDSLTRYRGRNASGFERIFQDTSRRMDILLGLSSTSLDLDVDYDSEIIR